MDLLTIGVIQLAALIYGLYIVAQGRPVWLVYDSARFEVVQAYEAVTDSKNKSSGVFRLGITGPVWGAVSDSVPQFVGRGETYYQAEFLTEYDEKIAAKVGANALPIALLERFNESATVDSILSEHPDANAFVPLAAKQKALSVLVNKEIGRPIAIVDLSPW